MSEPQASVEVEERPRFVAYAVLGGPLWWAVHLAGASALVPLACDRSASWLIDVLTVATAVGAAVAVAAGVRLHRRAGAEPPGAATERRRFLAFLSVTGGGISVALIVLEGLPNLVLGPCS